MPVNKNAMLRYLTLDKCFRNRGRRCFIEDLIEACNRALAEQDPKTQGIKRRQLYNDIRYMESEEGWFIPLDRLKDGKRTFYRYSDPTFSINNSPLKEPETKQLKSALMILARFKGLPQFSWVEELIPKLEQAFELKKGTEKVIGFENNPYLTGIEYLGELFDAITQKKPLKIHYHSFKHSEEEVSIIHPYYLKQYNQRWYLLGKTDKYDSLSVRALDRIKSIEPGDIPFLENTEYDFSEYFEDVIGINKGKDKAEEIIRLWFSPKMAPYIRTKPLHGSQKTKQDNKDGLIITIEVIPNYELESLLLSFGHQVKVLEPLWLHKKLKERSYV